ncbi:MAG: hypothetical protein FJ184_03070 [Gammaproteobacteria bacterium]|nr:hypothetical protein [Gammaproteobacteria bacterium]
MNGKRQSADSIHLAPKTTKIRVAISQLVPDPNNPRFTTSEDDRVNHKNTLDKAITGETFRRMRPNDDDPFKIDQLCSSIRENGWQPVDAMFVSKLEGTTDRYVVLEGNRRLTAINRLLSDDTVSNEDKDRLREIEVLEVLANGQDAQTVKDQITYLLGVRHHGSLKRWSAFAQAANIYRRYKELAGITDEKFVWNEECGNEVARALSISPANVRERLKVYIAMRQIGSIPSVSTGPGGIRDRHFSLVEEALKRKDLKSIIEQDPSTFALPSETADRFVLLCHFDKANRDGSPIKDPREWRALGKILTDQDSAKRDANLLKVMTEPKAFPSDIWAKRSAELRQLNWGMWLQRVGFSLSRIKFGDSMGGEDAKTLVRDLSKLLKRLHKKIES